MLLYCVLWRMQEIVEYGIRFECCTHIANIIPVHQTNGGLMLCQRRRQCVNIKSQLGQRLGIHSCYKQPALYLTSTKYIYPSRHSPTNLA